VRGGTDATIATVDKAVVNLGGYKDFELLPGRHVLHFEGLAGRLAGFEGLCLNVKPGHRYVIDMERGLENAVLVVTDETTGKLVSTKACSNQPEPEPGSGDFSAVPPPPPRLLMGLSLGIGYEGGGNNLVKAAMSNGENKDIDAGDGVVFPLGFTITPLWLGDIVGLGVGASAAIKAQSIEASNGKVSLLRYPLSFWLQSYLALSPKWFLSLSGGTNKDLAPSLSGEGVASRINADFNSSWGWFGDFGVLYLQTWHFGCGVSLHYTKLRYRIAGETLDASSFGLRMTFNMNY
jgi:hypothetical protein